MARAGMGNRCWIRAVAAVRPSTLVVRRVLSLRSDIGSPTCSCPPTHTSRPFQCWYWVGVAAAGGCNWSWWCASIDARKNVAVVAIVSPAPTLLIFLASALHPPPQLSTIFIRIVPSKTNRPFHDAGRYPSRRPPGGLLASRKALKA